MSKVILVSGGFDPIHDGHIAMLRSAARNDRVIVALNSDEWLMRKKGYVFMPWHVRATVLLAIRYVDQVVLVDDRDDTVCDALRNIRPDQFANGGDRIEPNEHEHAVCLELGIKELFHIGGDKVRSSSELVEAIR